MKINQSKSRNKGDSSLISFIFVVFCLFFFGLGMGLGRSIWVNEVIQHGDAHYTVNPQTGVTQFEWITNKIN